MVAESNASGSIEFGRFRLLPHRRELHADGMRVELGGRAFDLLAALVEARGTVLSKDALMSRVWPGRLVEENSLEAQIAALRRVLGVDRDLIRTVAGRGYQFTGEVRDATPAAVKAPPPAPTNLPEPASELIGRDAELAEVAELVRAHRLVTLIGAGGIGKTRLSQEAARRLLPRFADGVWVAELAPLADPGLVPVTVGGALGLKLAAGMASPERLAAALGTKQVLLVLDNCEHVIEAAARVAEALLHVSSAVCVMATSREPLRAEGEYLYRVPALEVPAQEVEETQELLRSGAVRLFVARASAAEPHFSLDQHVAAIAGAICRRLDGIPLAIELAAARSAALGVAAVAARLDDRFRLLTGGHRTALPRHQTLHATLDWSYGLLPEPERVVLRRLGVFAGTFTLDSTGAVAADAQLSASGVVEQVANLVAKSLVVANAQGGAVQYRLLETTRAYALEKLTQSGELAAVARRHAEHYRGMLERAAAEARAGSTAQGLAPYGQQLDNVRAALDWAFAANGDAEIGMALTVAAIPLWTHLSLMEECRARVEDALSAPTLSRRPRHDMQLYAALGAALLYTRGPVPEITSIWANALEIADSLGDTDYRLRALWGLWVDGLTSSDFPGSLAFARRFSDQATDSADLAVGDRMAGISLLYLGEPAKAREHIERMLSRYVAPAHGSHVIRFQFDQRVMARMTLGQILWLQGFPDEAMRTVEGNVDYAASVNHALSLCNALGQAACPIALLNGDFAAAERFLSTLHDTTARHSLSNWYGFTRCFKAVLLIRRGDLVTGLDALHAALSEFPRTGWALRYTAFSGEGELAEALSLAGAVEEALAVVDGALARLRHNEERWCIAELLRVRGELRLKEGGTDAPVAAEDCFQQGLDWARRQGALAWELRCATSLARLRQTQGSSGQAYDILEPVYARFTEGFATADLLAAKAVLEALR